MALFRAVTIHPNTCSNNSKGRSGGAEMYAMAHAISAKGKAKTVCAKTTKEVYFLIYRTIMLVLMQVDGGKVSSYVRNTTPISLSKASSKRDMTTSTT